MDRCTPRREPRVSSGASMDAQASVGIDALELFVEVLSQSEPGTESSARRSTTGCATRSAGWRGCAAR